MSDKDGGPAFPIPGLHADPDFNGMTLRDYFAAKAISGALSTATGLESVDDDTLRAAFASGAKHAYMLADAMLAERAK